MRASGWLAVLLVVLLWSGTEAAKKKKNRDRSSSDREVGEGSDNGDHVSNHERADSSSSSSSEEKEQTYNDATADPPKTRRVRYVRHYRDPYDLSRGTRHRRNDKLGRNKELGELGPQGSKDETWKEISANMKKPKATTKRPSRRRRSGSLRRHRNVIIHEMHHAHRYHDE